MLSNENILSKTITFLRLPLIVAVVYIHTSLHEFIIGSTASTIRSQFPIYNIFHHIITDEIARLAVPLFFFISGFLFFYKSDFSISIYKKKLKSRFHSLLIPYIFWNALVLLLLFLTHMFFPSMTSGKAQPFAHFSILDFISAFWSFQDGMPVCFQFWFIRDLMVVVLFTPLVYIALKTGKVASLLFLAVLWLFGIWFHITGISISAFFFFSFGAYFSIMHTNFAVALQKLRLPAVTIYFIIISLSTWLWLKEDPSHPVFHNLGIIAGSIAVIAWTAYGIKTGILHANIFFAEPSFFIYAYHAMPLIFVGKLWVKFFAPLNEFSILIGYLTIPVIIVIAGIGIYYVLKRYLPTFTNIITGGR